MECVEGVSICMERHVMQRKAIFMEFHGNKTESNATRRHVINLGQCNRMLHLNATNRRMYECSVYCVLYAVIGVMLTLCASYGRYSEVTYGVEKYYGTI